MVELLALLCLGLAWLVPNHYPPWSSFYNESCAGLAVLMLALAQARGNWSRPAPRIVWVVSATAAIPWLQWACGQLAFSGDALVSSLYVLGLAAAIAVGHAWACRARLDAAVHLAVTVLAAALISTVLAMMQGFLVGDPGIWIMDAEPGMRPYANLGQPNNLATLIGFGLMGVLLLYERGKLQASVSVLLAAVLLGGLAMTQSRTALVSGPATLLGLWLAKQRGVALKTRLRWVGLAVGVHWLLTWVWPTLQNTLLFTSASVGVAQRGGGSVRLSVWREMIDALSARPWQGFGWLQVGEAQLSVAERFASVHEMWLHAHNLFLDLLLWCGLPIGLLLSGAILYWYVSRVRRVATLEAVLALLSVTWFGVHAMLELPHHYAYFLVPTGLWIGQIESAIAARGGPGPRWNLVPLALALAMTLGIWRDYRAVEDDFRLVRFENLRIGSVRATQPAPDAPLLSSLTAFLRFSRTEPVAGMSKEQMALMESVGKRYPYAPSLYRWARTLALNGRPDEARLTMIRLRSIHGDPYYDRLRKDLLQRVADGESGLRTLAESLPE